MRVWRVGTRGSLLAQIQTDWVLSRLSQLFPKFLAEKVIIRTAGDRIADLPLQKVPGKGFFVKEIEEALLNGRINFAVHSLKDLPSDLPEGLTLAAVCQRIEKRDVIVAPKGTPFARSFEDLVHLIGETARIGTSSLRRKVQLLRQFPRWAVDDTRGNIDTRLRKLDSGQYDALVVAGAGLLRLGLEDRISAYLPEEVCCPAPGQGALAVEARSDDLETLSLLRAIDELPVRIEVVAERAVVASLRAGCRTPLGACATYREGTLHLRAIMADPDGSDLRRAEDQCTLVGDPDQHLEQARALGESVAQRLQGERSGP